MKRAIAIIILVELILTPLLCLGTIQQASTINSVPEETTIEVETDKTSEVESITVEHLESSEPTTEPPTESTIYPDPNTGKVYDTPSNDSFKSYMDYRKITVKTSPHYKLQQIAYTDPATGIRMIDGRYCMAVGSYYTTKIGTKIDAVLTTGVVIPGILADCKADIHTDKETHRQNPNGSVIEFVVDKDQLPYKPMIMGDISHMTDEWMGDIDFIIVYE